MHSTYFCLYFYILLHISSESLILLTYFRIFCFKTELWWIQQIWLDNALDHRECSLLDAQHLHYRRYFHQNQEISKYSKKSSSFVFAWNAWAFSIEILLKNLYFIRMKCNTTDIYQYICVCNVFTCIQEIIMCFPDIQTRKASVCAIKSF